MDSEEGAEDKSMILEGWKLEWLGRGFYLLSNGSFLVHFLSCFFGRDYQTLDPRSVELRVLTPYVIRSLLLCPKTCKRALENRLLLH